MQSQQVHDFRILRREGGCQRGRHSKGREVFDDVHVRAAEAEGEVSQVAEAGAGVSVVETL